MKNIFTYPLNPETNYVDPDYVGDANSGLTRRVDELLAGDYKSWQGLDPVSDLGVTTAQAEENLSKFINYLDDNTLASNLTMYDFWDKPMVIATKQLIGTKSVSQVTYSSVNQETIFTTSTPHEFEDAMMLIMAGFDGDMLQYNGDTFYAKVLSTTTLQLSNNIELTDLLVVGENSVGTFNTLNWEYCTNNFYSQDEDSVLHIDMNTFVPDPGNNPVFGLIDGTGVRINSVARNGYDLVSNTYYTARQGSGFYALFQDSELTNPLFSSEITGFDLIDGRIPGRAQVQLTYTENGAVDLTNEVSGSTNFEINTENPLTDEERWVYLPLSQQENQYNRKYHNYLWNPNLHLTPGYWGSYTGTADTYAENRIPSPLRIPDYYKFNDYRSITVNPDRSLRMIFTSAGVGYRNPDDTYQYYDYEVLDQMHFSPAHKKTQHSVLLFPGFKFENIDYDPTWGLPLSGDIVNQPGKPVCEPQSVYMNFGSKIPGNSSVTISSQKYDGWDNQQNIVPNWGNMKRIQAVIWNPAVDIEDYRADWDEYGNVNIMSKDIWGNYTVNEYGYFNDPVTGSPVNPNAPALVVSVAWIRNPASDTAALFLHSTVAESIRHYVDDIQQSDVTLAMLNDFWNTSYTTTDTIEIKISPCPYSVATHLPGGNNFNAYNDLNRYYYNSATPQTPYKIPFSRSTYSAGIEPNIRVYPYVGAMPTPFIAHNELTMSPRVTGSVNAEFLLEDEIIANNGSMAPDSGEPLPYEIGSVEIALPGNKVYSYQDTNNDTQLGARVDPDYYWPAGSEFPYRYTTANETPAQFNVTVDSNGRLSGVTLVEEADAEGRFETPTEIVLPIESLPDTYVPVPQTPAEQQDNWDTDDEWATTDYNPRKEWPTVVTPMNANIVLNTPSTINKSQNGIKYTRASGFTKWTLEVNYPPMRAEQFREFHAVAQAANGQATPFYFVLRNTDGNNILWPDFGKEGTSTHVLFKEPAELGDTTVLLEGFAGFEENALQRGEVFIDGVNENGALHTAVNTVQANVFGEAKVRTAMPLREAQVEGRSAFKDPYHAVVTLNSDDFSYSIDAAGFYTMSVAFELDGWK